MNVSQDLHRPKKKNLCLAKTQERPRADKWIAQSATCLRPEVLQRPWFDLSRDAEFPVATRATGAVQFHAVAAAACSNPTNRTRRHRKWAYVGPPDGREFDAFVPFQCVRVPDSAVRQRPAYQRTTRRGVPFARSVLHHRPSWAWVHACVDWVPPACVVDE